MSAENDDGAAMIQQNDGSGAAPDRYTRIPGLLPASQPTAVFGGARPIAVQGDAIGGALIGDEGGFGELAGERLDDGVGAEDQRTVADDDIGPGGEEGALAGRVTGRGPRSPYTPPQSKLVCQGEGATTAIPF